MLEHFYKVSSKFKNSFDILCGPAKGIAKTVRQYAVGNQFTKASKYVSTELVSFLKDTYWKEVSLS